MSKISTILKVMIYKCIDDVTQNLRTKTNRQLTFAPILRIYYSQLTACDFQQTLTFTFNPPDNTKSVNN